MKILLNIIVFFAFAGNIFAQNLLTVQEAVTVALENNFDIRITSNLSKIDANNVSVGNAGMLPILDATFNKNNVVQNSKQTQQTGEVRELNNAKNNSMTYGLSLGWTVFDGMGMFARYNQLKEIQKQGETELKQMVLAKTAEVMAQYFDLVQQQQLLKAFDTTIVISQQRLKTAENRFTIGKASKLEVLNAKVDLNADLSNFAKQKEIVQNGKTKLNELLARDLKTDFVVEDTARFNANLKLDELMTLSEKQNPELQLALINKRIVELEQKKVKAARYPVIQLSSGYNFSETESSLGFVSQSESRGLNYGLSAKFNIFNGFRQNQNEKTAKLQLENSNLVLEQQKQSLTSRLMMIYQGYLTNMELVQLEQDNEAVAKQNLEITLEKFRIGTVPAIEFRNAQENYVNAVARSQNSRFQAKISEVLLQEIAGNVTF